MERTSRQTFVCPKETVLAAFATDDDAEEASDLRSAMSLNSIVDDE